MGKENWRMGNERDGGTGCGRSTLWARERLQMSKGNKEIEKGDEEKDAKIIENNFVTFIS